MVMPYPEHATSLSSRVSNQNKYAGSCNGAQVHLQRSATPRGRRLKSGTEWIAGHYNLQILEVPVITVLKTFIRIAAIAIMLAASGQSSGQEAPSQWYETENIHGPLPERPASVDLDTPQGLLETFLFAARHDDFERAAYALDLSDAPPDMDADYAARLAHRLYEVLERSTLINWAEFPDRPDAIDETSSDKYPLAGEPRRNIRISLVELPDRTVSIRIHRVKTPTGDPVWVFSSTTVTNINAMFEVYGPRQFEQMLPGFLQEPAFLTLKWWEVFILPIILLIALLSAWSAYRGTGWLAARQPSELVNRIVKTLRLPLALMVFAGIFAIVTRQLFTFSGLISALLYPAVTIIFTIAIALVALRVVDAFLDTVQKRNSAESGEEPSNHDRELYTNISAARRAAVVIAALCGTGLVLYQVNAFQTLGFSILVSAGFLGLVFAFAARTVLSNIMSSLQIALSKSARVGDAVCFEGDWCYVERINFTHLTLRSWDDRRIIAPVNYFVSHPFENWSKNGPSLIKTVDLKLDHHADVGALRKAFSIFVTSDDDVIEKDEAKLLVTDHDYRAMTITCYARAADPSTGWDMHCRLREFMLAEIGKLEAELLPEREGRPAYFPREREIQLGTEKASGA